MFERKIGKASNLCYFSPPPISLSFATRGDVEPGSLYILSKQTLYHWATPVGHITYFLVEKHIVASMKPIMEKQNKQLCTYIGGIGKQPQREAGSKVGHEESVSVYLDASCVCELPQLQYSNFLYLISKNPSQSMKECLRLHLLHKS